MPVIVWKNDNKAIPEGYERKRDGVVTTEDLILIEDADGDIYYIHSIPYSLGPGDTKYMNYKSNALKFVGSPVSDYIAVVSPVSPPTEPGWYLAKRNVIHRDYQWECIKVIYHTEKKRLIALNEGRAIYTQEDLCNYIWGERIDTDNPRGRGD